MEILIVVGKMRLSKRSNGIKRDKKYKININPKKKKPLDARMKSLKEGEKEKENFSFFLLLLLGNLYFPHRSAGR